MGIEYRHCSSECTRKGRRGGVQLYQCRTCHKYQRSAYRNKACETGTDDSIAALLKEGCGIRGIARLLGISPTTVIARIRRIARGLRRPYPLSFGRSYEVDELATYCRRKADRVWVAYARERESGHIANFVIGRRTKQNLGAVLTTVLLTEPKRIATDRLDIYRCIVPDALHEVKAFGINRIERNNLTLRTQLKRLSRRTICFTKQLDMLHACVAILFWGERRQMIPLKCGQLAHAHVLPSDLPTISTGRLRQRG